MNPKVFLGVPCYGNVIDVGTATQIISSVSQSKYLAGLKLLSYSVTQTTMNMLYAEALNQREKSGITHFLMLHADVRPSGNFVDKIVDLAKEHKADIMSAIIPIKNAQGLTSTAFDQSLDGSDPHYRPRRLTMNEVFDMNPTFTHPELLVNTGCMLIDIRKPFAEQCSFKFEDSVKMGDGGFVAVTVPEDWNYSRQARKHGASIYATREVGITHMGTAGYSNMTPWGLAKHDSLSL